MLVGEVRGATSMCSESWVLSGGSQFMAGPTRSSKKRQVRRASLRRKALLARWNRWRLWLRTGRASHCINRGDRAHKIKKRAVGAKTLWMRMTIMRMMEHPETISIWRMVEVKCECASEALSAVCHSSKWWRLIQRR